MDAVESIKAKLSIEDVVAPYVTLKRSGSSFKANCPFHEEKTPSFIVSPAKGLAYCFGCRKGGDIFAFIQEVERIDFTEALKFLAEKAGVMLESGSLSRQEKKGKKRFLEALEKAQSFFSIQLKEHKEPLSYLASRGFPVEKALPIGLGFATNDFHTLCGHLRSLGFSEDEILGAGLASQKQPGSKIIYDRFRNRVTFPIRSSQGALIGFGGRTLGADPKDAKYLNSPETSVYQKRHQLYQLYEARESIRQTGNAVVVEGYFDALSLHLHGFTNTVASLGTALTEEQLGLLRRFTNTVLFAFDADQSGQSAAERSAELAQKMGLEVKIIQIPGKKDPDEVVRESPENWRAAIEKALPIMAFCKRRALSVHSKATAEGKKRITEELLPIIQRFPSAVERDHYLQDLSMELQVSIESLLQDTKRISLPRPAASRPEETKSQRFAKQDYLLGLMLNYPTMIEQAVRLVDEDLFPEGEQKRLYSEVKNSYPAPEKGALSRVENDTDKERLELLALYTEEKYSSFSVPDLEKELSNLCASINHEHRIARLKSLRFRIAQAEEEGAPKSEHQRALKEYSELLKRDLIPQAPNP